jgi:hypothetical protein
MKTPTLFTNPIHSRSLRRGSILITLGLACFALSPTARAVCQDGCGGTNTFLGEGAFINDTFGLFDTAIGNGALGNNNGGRDNTATGYLALTSNIIGSDNTANGYQALEFNTGFGNTAIGATALQNNTTGDNNTANGDQAMVKNTTGGSNTATGAFALRNNTTGSFNIALGEHAGSKITTGSNNIDIGNTGVLAGEDSKIRIGTTGTHMATFIAGISGETVPSGVGVIVGTDGKLGTIVSSSRFKDQIKPMDKASEAILSLQPVTFHYKQELDPEGIPQFGLVAEEVEKVNPDLVARDGQGKPYIVRYEAVNAMLLNEFLKEHRKVEQQRKDFEAALAQQQKQIDALTEGLQKVSAQLEVSRRAQQIVLNNQ